MIDLIGAIAVLAVVALILWVFVGFIPGRRQYKVEMVSQHTDANHLAMRDMLVDLLALDRRGYIAVFPDDDTRQLAQELVATYQEGTNPHDHNHQARRLSAGRYDGDHPALRRVRVDEPPTE